MITLSDIQFETAGKHSPDSWLQDLARLRIEVFRAFPYLYEGDLSYEQKYLRRYIDSERSILVTASYKGKIIGASTGIHLSDETRAIRDLFTGHGFDISKGFYYGESVLLSEYRGLGIGKKFFAMREREARRQNCAFATFCAVERPADHPARPASYEPLDRLWKGQGFEQRPDMVTTFSWKDLGDDNETSKNMVFWVKDLA